MKNFYYFLIKENGIILVIWATMIAIIIITINGLAATVEIERNSVMAEIVIPHKNIKKSILGTASYYDYILKSGWSSVGHFVCATREFERYSMIKVTDLSTGKWVICKKTDHGPDMAIFPERVVDLSSTAFKALAPLTVGLIKKVKLEQVN